MVICHTSWKFQWNTPSEAEKTMRFSSSSIYIYIYVFISTSCWWAYKIQIELQITCNLYTHICAGSTQQYIMITVTDEIDSLQVQLTGSPRDRHAKTHAGPPTGIPQPGLWLVGGCSASQSEARPENPRRQHEFMHRTLPELHSRNIYTAQFLNISVHLVSLFIHWMYVTCSSNIDWFPLWNILIYCV